MTERFLGLGLIAGKIRQTLFQRISERLLPFNSLSTAATCANTQLTFSVGLSFRQTHTSWQLLVLQSRSVNLHTSQQQYPFFLARVQAYTQQNTYSCLHNNFPRKFEPANLYNLSTAYMYRPACSNVQTTSLGVMSSLQHNVYALSRHALGKRITADKHASVLCRSGYIPWQVCCLIWMFKPSNGQQLCNECPPNLPPLPGITIKRYAVCSCLLSNCMLAWFLSWLLVLHIQHENITFLCIVHALHCDKISIFEFGLQPSLVFVLLASAYACCSFVLAASNSPCLRGAYAVSVLCTLVSVFAAINGVRYSTQTSDCCPVGSGDSGRL